MSKEITSWLHRSIAGVESVADSAGVYEITLVGGSKRTATAQEIADAQAAELTEAIKAHRDHLRTAGCPIGNGVVIHSDDTSRIQQIGLVMLGTNIPAGLKWKAMGGTYLDMTPTLANQIFGAQAQRDTVLFAHAEKLIADVKAAADPAKVDITVGWPD